MSAGTDAVTTSNPVDGSPLATYPAMGPNDVEAAVVSGHRAAAAWGLVPVADRAAGLTRLAAHLRADAERYAALVTAEMGKPLAEARGEVEKSAVTADYYAGHAEHILRRRAVEIDSPANVSAFVQPEPLGLVLAVMPWNFPVWQVMRFAIPTLAAGNGVLLKHSPNVTGSALALADAFVAAGFPEHLVTTLVVAEPEVPETVGRLIADPRIAAVTLTGSNRAGEMVGAAAGRASKKSVLELGGSDAFVVLADADVPAAAAAAVRARFTNSGQSCVCAKRFVVEEPVAAEFTRLFLEGVAALVLGDPTDPATTVGPLARADLRDALQRQVDESVAAGATLAAGGRSVDGPGCFYEPTVLLDVHPGMAVFDEETFGPVAAVAVARDEEHAVALADATQYGLGLSVWSRDTERAIDVARRITSGAAFVNAVVASDPRVPFGGTRRSGYGRELAEAGVLEFTNQRTYWVASA
ncbi:NAD-dependent succinate-semialdehyde dehydrogenase [Pedococcus aerophilus]|uniref:NAD-dependent succinate-semialdehyde dehydrogenase n=1 Tax=Pedococcus aerophilus TaxID=436356 RepID=A0ABP6H8W8_9MICO